MKNASGHLRCVNNVEPLSVEETVITLDVGESFSKTCDIWFHKGYIDKEEKPIRWYLNLYGVQAFSVT